MDKAIAICDGEERLVSAEDIRRRFHGIRPFNIKFICPLCRQPLNTASMNSSTTIPHFRHERGNPFAQQCENYVRAYGYPSAYQRAPLPMYIRQSRDDQAVYIVEAGFRHIKPSLLKTLQSDGAVLRIDDRRYNITESRFGSGITRLPLKAPTLDCSAHISIEHTQLGMQALWGIPLDATKALVFSHDEETQQGRRLHPGDTVQSGNRLFILVPTPKTNSVLAAFPHSAIVGHTGITLASPSLQVCDVVIPADAKAGSGEYEYLKSCGIEVTENEQAASLVWPPSIMSDGNAMPLFGKSKCIFRVPRVASNDRKLYIHTSLDSHDHVRTETLNPTANPTYLYCATSCANELSVVSAGNWNSNSILLIHPADSLDQLIQTPLEEELHTSISDDGVVQIESNVKCSIEIYRTGSPVKSLTLTRENPEWSVKRLPRAAIRVQIPLESSVAMRTMVDLQWDNQSQIATSPQSQSPGMHKSQIHCPTDLLRAHARAEGKNITAGRPLGWTIASIRKEHS